MKANIGSFTVKLRENPKKTGTVSLFILIILLAGMYQVGVGEQKPLEDNDSDFNYSELDPQPENQTNSTNSTNETGDSINVSVTNQTCVEVKNQSDYCTTN